KKKKTDAIIPLCWTILSGKSQQDYYWMFTHLFDLLQEFDTVCSIYINMDFERAMINTIETFFKERAIIVCCWAHLAKNIQININDKGSGELRNSQDYKEMIKVEIEELAKGGLTKDAEKDIQTFKDDVERFVKKWYKVSGDFVEYLMKYYLYEDSVYPPKLWSRRWIRYEDHVGATNNILERDNREMNKLRNMQVKFPTPKKFIEILKTLEHNARTNAQFSEE